MGPAATADFLTRLVNAAGATRDSDHPHVLVDSNPGVPDRNAALAEQGPSPGPELARMAQALVAGGAEVLAMPCNAAHGWAGDIRAAVPQAIFVDLIAAATAEVAALAPKPRCIGLLAIKATRAARLYHIPLEGAGFTVLEPDDGAFAAVIARIKGGDSGPDARAAMRAIAESMIAVGADALLGACTEVPLVLGVRDVPVPFVDATAALVTATLAAARR